MVTCGVVRQPGVVVLVIVSGQLFESNLSEVAVAGPFDPGDDHDPESFVAVLALAFEETESKQGDEALHRCVVAALTGLA